MAKLTPTGKVEPVRDPVQQPLASWPTGQDDGGGGTTHDSACHTPLTGHLRLRSAIKAAVVF